MGTNLKQFVRELRKAAKKVKEENLVKFHIAVSLEAFKRIVLRTPVDTGRARGNWQFQINRPASGTFDFEGDESNATAKSFEQFNKLAGIKPFSIVHITNNIEYVYYLEYVRRSSQHPDGMVEITLEELKNWVSKL